MKDNTKKTPIKKIAILKSDVFFDPNTKEDRIYNLFKEFFKTSGYELSFYDVIHNKFPSPTAYDLYLITGSRHSVYEPLDWIQNLENYIINNRLPKLIGLCFGHQIIAQARGGKVQNCGWHVGVKPVTFYSSANHIYNLRFNHQDHVIEPPKDAAVLASSPECQYAMLQQGGHTLTMQFHPEFTPEHHSKVIDRINSHNGFSPNQYEVFKKDILGNEDVTKALQVMQTFLSF